jgi:hypothetical protein
MGGPLVWGILFALSAVLLADSLAKYARGEGSLLDVGLNMLGVIPGGRLLTALGKVAGLSRTGTKGLAGLAAARTAVTRMAANVRNGLRRRMTVLGGEAGSASVDTLTLGLSRLVTRPARFSKLTPSHTYQHNGATFRTDVKGRVEEVVVPRLARGTPERDGTRRSWSESKVCPATRAVISSELASVGPPRPTTWSPRTLTSTWASGRPWRTLGTGLCKLVKMYRSR